MISSFQVGEVRVGSGDLFLIAGPCVIESEEHAMRMAEIIKGVTKALAFPFINPHVRAGTAYTVFELSGWKCGMLICYDNNVIENVRATAFLGAEIIFMPHVTMCTPSTRPGAGFVDPALWLNRDHDPTSLRAEFDGLKGRAWLMKWLPARAHEIGRAHV